MAKLRPPTQAERAAGLPTSKAEAIKLGLSRFMHADGKERVIRNYGSQSFPNGNVAFAESRRSNRGGGTDGARKQSERLVTPDDATRKAADKQMSRANSQGKVSHHGLPIAKLAAGERAKPGTIARYEAVHGKNNVGHATGNLFDMSPADHDYIHHKQEPALHKSIKRAGSQSDLIFSSLRRQVLLRNGIPMGGNVLLAIGPDLMEIVDSNTNGAVSNGINGTVDAATELVVNGLNGWKSILTSLVGQENRDRATNYGQW
jgi:hypothetical protein